MKNILRSTLWIHLSVVLTLIILFSTIGAKDTNAQVIVPNGQQVTITRGVGPYWTVLYPHSRIYFSGNSLRVEAYTQVGVIDRNWYASNRIEVWIDGQRAQLPGRPAGANYYDTVRSVQSAANCGGSSGCQSVDLIFNATLPGVDLSTGTHTAEVRLYAVIWSNSSNAFQAYSGSSASGGEDNNCGQTAPCYSRLIISPPAATPPPTPPPAQPTASISVNPTTAWAPGGTTISWSTANIPGGVSCANNWNSFLPITPNTSGSDYRTLGSGTHTFAISCSNGTGASTTFTVNQLPPPSIQALGTDCNYSQPRVLLRVTSPSASAFPHNTVINISHSGGLAYQVNLSPGQSYDVWSSSFYGGYANPAPNGYTTFYATTNHGSLTPSNPASVPVFLPNCPSQPTISSISPVCNAGNYLPYNNIHYSASTYGSPTAYHLDRKLSSQSFASHGDGHVGTFSNSANPLQDGNNVLNNTSYIYRMRADNGSYQSFPSNIVGTTSSNCSPPAITASARCIDNLATPEYTIHITANANDSAANKWNYIDWPGHQNLAQIQLTPGQSASRTFTSPPIPNGAVTQFSAYSWYNNYSFTNYASVNAPDCSLPRQFTVSLNTSAGAVCPAANGLPRLNVNIGKSANAVNYSLYTFKLVNGSYQAYAPGNHTYSYAELFGSATVVSNVGTATRSFNVDPNSNYRVYVIAWNGPVGSSSFIFSNYATANTNPPTDPAVYANIGWCDNTPPTIVPGTIAKCFQPNNLPSTFQITVVDNPGSGAPASSVSGVNPAQTQFLLNELNVPASVQQFPYQSQTGNTYSRLFYGNDFFAGIDKDYELSARACDFNNNCSNMNKVLVSYAQVCGAWIQTRQGNVHSERGINAPGGPQ